MPLQIEIISPPSVDHHPTPASLCKQPLKRVVMQPSQVEGESFISRCYFGRRHLLTTHTHTILSCLRWSERREAEYNQDRSAACHRCNTHRLTTTHNHIQTCSQAGPDRHNDVCGVWGDCAQSPLEAPHKIITTNSPQEGRRTVNKCSSWLK